MTRSQAAVAGFQQCLALEHEAIWIYGYLGGKVSGVADRAHTSYESHRKIRDTLITMLHDSQSTVPGPKSDYALTPVKNTAQAKAVARTIESRGQAAYLALVGSTEAADREYALRMLRKAALAGLAWGATPSAFPGLPA